MKLIPKFLNGYKINPEYFKHYRDYKVKDELNKLPDSEKDEYLNKFDIKNFAELQEKIKKLKMNPSLINTEYTDKYLLAGLTNDDSLK